MNQAVDSDDGYRSVGGIRGLYANIGDAVTKWLFPIALLAARIYVGWVFFKSGWARLMTCRKITKVAKSHPGNVNRSANLSLAARGGSLRR